MHPSPANNCASSKQIDIILIGQGLAGSLLAYHLIQQGVRVFVIDQGWHGSSSRVAAGIINPIFGRKLSLLADYSLYYSQAQSDYTALEKQLNTQIWHPQTQHKQLDDTQLARVKKALQEPTYSSYLSLQTSPTRLTPKASIARIQHCAQVDCQAFLFAMQKWLQSQDAYCASAVDYTKIKADEAGVSIGDIRAKRLVLCEGHQAIHNPWLQHLPFNLSKGDILDVNIESHESLFLNWGHWLIKNASSNIAKLGATFDWNWQNPTAKAENAHFLLQSLKHATGMDTHILQHKTGIRPTTHSRQVFIGTLSKLPNCYCFNGFGTRGCLLIPYYAKQFAHQIQTNLHLKTSPILYLSPQQQTHL